MKKIETNLNLLYNHKCNKMTIIALIKSWSTIVYVHTSPYKLTSKSFTKI